MKKKYLIIVILTFFSCATTINVDQNKKPLYEVLIQQTYGGASIRFFEILSEPNEVVMLQKDQKLKNRIHPDDIKTSNFVIMNLGEKSTIGYGIKIESVVETDKNIIITTKDITPIPGSITIQQITNPYYVVKINSKKNILFK
jgi:serine protease inhibitor ecotin